MIKTYITGRLGLFKKGQSLLKRQQRIAFALYAVAVVVGLLANLCGLTGPQRWQVLLQNGVFLLVTLSLVAACMFRKLRLARTFCLMTISTQLFTCTETLFCLFTPSDYDIMLVIGNMFLLMGNLLFALVAYMELTAYLLAGMSVVTYMASVWITGDSTLENFMVLVVLMFVVVAALGNLLVKNLNRLNRENEELRGEEREMLDVLKMERDEVRAYIRLAKSRHEIVESDRLLFLLGEESRRNIIRNVNEAVTARKMERTELSSVFPELSPSELEICRLVILGKTLKEVCTLLNKAESNVTCQRRNIRKKLGLTPGDDLREVLLGRFNKGRNENG